MNRKDVIHIVIGAALLAGCDSNSSQPEITGIPLPSPVVAANFSQNVANPNTYLPYVVGTVWTSEGTTPEGHELSIEKVTDRKKIVQGVTCTVVRHRAFLNGQLLEDTDDWYAQDKDGNVWYFGEDVKNYDANGQVKDRHGSWEAGVDGAMAGIIMWAQPRAGSVYYQEYYKDKAEDVGEVLALNEKVTVPAGTFDGCIKTEDTTPLEPDQVEHKYYCPGVGQVKEVNLKESFSIELVELTH